MMKPPRSLKVGGYEVPLVVDQEGFLDGEFGQFDSNGMRIMLRADVPPAVQRATLVHEILHLCIALTNLSNLDIKDEQEEIIVSALEPHLYDILRRNPNLLKFLGAD